MSNDSKYLPRSLDLHASKDGNYQRIQSLNPEIQFDQINLKSTNGRQPVYNPEIPISNETGSSNKKSCSTEVDRMSTICVYSPSTSTPSNRTNDLGNTRKSCQDSHSAKKHPNEKPNKTFLTVKFKSTPEKNSSARPSSKGKSQRKKQTVQPSSDKEFHIFSFESCSNNNCDSKTPCKECMDTLKRKCLVEVPAIHDQSLKSKEKGDPNKVPSQRSTKKTCQDSLSAKKYPNEKPTKTFLTVKPKTAPSALSAPLAPLAPPAPSAPPATSGFSISPATEKNSRIARPSYVCEDAYDTTNISSCPAKTTCRPRNLECLEENTVVPTCPNDPHVIQIPYDVVMPSNRMGNNTLEYSEISKSVNKPINVHLNLKFIPQETCIEAPSSPPCRISDDGTSCDRKYDSYDCIFSDMNDTLKDIKTGIDCLKENQQRLLGQPIVSGPPCRCENNSSYRTIKCDSHHDEPATTCMAATFMDSCYSNRAHAVRNEPCCSKAVPIVEKRTRPPAKKDRHVLDDDNPSCFNQFKHFWYHVICYKVPKDDEIKKIRRAMSGTSRSSVENDEPSYSQRNNNNLAFLQNNMRDCQAGMCDLKNTMPSTANQPYYEMPQPCSRTRNGSIYNALHETGAIYGPDKSRLLYTKEIATTLPPKHSLKKKHRQKHNVLKSYDDVLINNVVEGAVPRTAKFTIMPTYCKESEEELVNVRPGVSAELLADRRSKESNDPSFNRKNERDTEHDYAWSKINIKKKLNDGAAGSGDRYSMLNTLTDTSRSTSDEPTLITSYDVICNSATTVDIDENVAERCSSTDFIPTSYRQTQNQCFEEVYPIKCKNDADNEMQMQKKDNLDQVMKYYPNQIFQQNIHDEVKIPVRKLLQNFKVFEEIKLSPRDLKELDKSIFPESVTQKSAREYKFSECDTNPIRLKSAQRVEQATDIEPERLKQDVVHKHNEKVQTDKPRKKLTNCLSGDIKKETKMDANRNQQKREMQPNLIRKRVKSVDSFDKARKTSSYQSDTKQFGKEPGGFNDGVEATLESVINDLAKPLFDVPHRFPFFDKSGGIGHQPVQIAGLVSRQTSTEITTHEISTQSTSGVLETSSSTISTLEHPTEKSSSSSSEATRNCTMPYDNKKVNSEFSVDECNSYKMVSLPPHKYAENPLLANTSEGLDTINKESSKPEPKIVPQKIKNRIVETLHQTEKQQRSSKNPNNFTKTADTLRIVKVKAKLEALATANFSGFNYDTSPSLVPNESNNNTESKGLKNANENKEKQLLPLAKIKTNAEDKINTNNRDNQITPMFSSPSKFIFSAITAGYPLFAAVNTQERHGNEIDESDSSSKIMLSKPDNSSIKSRVPIIISHLKNAKYELCMARASASGLTASYSQRKIDEALIHNRKITNKIIEYPRRSTIKLSKIKESLFEIILTQSNLYRQDKSVPRIRNNNPLKNKNMLVRIHSVPNGTMLLKSIKKQLAFKDGVPYKFI